MTGFERITFVILSESDDENIKPLTSIKSDLIPGDIKLFLRVGFVGLKPSSRYHFKIFITPLQLKLKVGEQAELQNPFMESAKMFIDTPESSGNDTVDGQLTVSMGKVNIAAKGIYQVRSVLTDSDQGDAELHELTTFFAVDRKND